MNLSELQRRLIATARANPPSERVPYAFEGRVMAQLAEVSAPDCWSLWARGLWRAAAPCVAVMLVLGAWSWFTATPTPSGDLSQELEHTLLVAVEQDQPATDSTW